MKKDNNDGWMEDIFMQIDAGKYDEMIDVSGNNCPEIKIEIQVYQTFKKNVQKEQKCTTKQH